MEIIKDYLISRIEIPNYLEHIQLSKSRRPIYYKKGDKIPKKYLDKTKYNFNSKNILTNVIDDEKILKNSRSVGKPRLKKISGQDIWSGINHNLRSKIAKELKYYLRKQFKDLNLKGVKKNDYPIGIGLEFHKPIGEANWDIDNHSLIFRKCILDALKGDYIEDDSVFYVRSIPCEYYDCLEKDKKLVITLFRLYDNNNH